MSNNHQDNIQDVLEQLSSLEPTALEQPKPARQALASLRARRALTTERPSFWAQLLAPSRRPSVVFTTLLLFFLASFAFPAVRAAASDFLGLFRVQKFAAISISPEQIAILQQIAEDGLTPGELELVDEPREPRIFDSLGEAARETGLTPRTLVGLAEPTTVHVNGGVNGRFIIDLAGARAILEATGSNPALLPDSLDEQSIEIETYPAIAQAWENDGLMLLQTESPNVTYPNGLDATLIGQAILRALGLNEADAARLAQEIDWTGTLLLPIPQDVATYQEVFVDGVSGIAVSSITNEGNVIIWQKDGLVYMLGGDMETDALLALVPSLR